ncbi:MAG: urease accessory protein [Deltaproteobacteria bacterium]|nr:urease accessory protein [Deltaproteobacteria bacterium]
MLAVYENEIGWRAELALDYQRRGARTVLAARRHDGPLVVQKSLYPEGDGVCHSIVVHPPGGIAGGDDLRLSARLDVTAHALLTTPGAGKWYRSAGELARQSLQFDISPGACLEWLPQENIIFNQAHAEMRTAVRLAGDSSFIGWEICCLGRSGSGEKFSRGNLRARTLIERDGRPLWFENGRLEGGGAALRSAVVMADRTVVGTLLVASAKLDSTALNACRALRPINGAGAATLLPGLIVGRYLGASSEAAKNYFIQLWHILRLVVVGREAIDPRIWRT